MIGFHLSHLRTLRFFSFFPSPHTHLSHNNVCTSPHVFLCECTAFWSYYGCERSHAGGTGSLRQLWNVHIVNLEARRRLFDSRLMRRTGKPLVVGRLTRFSSLMRFDKNRLQGEENSIYFFCLFVLSSYAGHQNVPWHLLLLWSLIGLNGQSGSFLTHGCTKPFRLGFYWRCVLLFFFPVVALFINIWPIWKYNTKGTFCFVYQDAACVEPAVAAFGKNVARHCGNVSGRRLGLSL